MDEIDRRRMEVAERWEQSLKAREEQTAARESALIERLDAWTRQRQEADASLRKELDGLSARLTELGRLQPQLSAFTKRLDELETQLSAVSRD